VIVNNLDENHTVAVPVNQPDDQAFYTPPGTLPTGPLLRTLDAIHLASASSLGATLGGFVAYDARLAQAARNLGLTVFSPGLVDRNSE
jgi:predicted nucleic acid-binding protein